MTAHAKPRQKRRVKHGPPDRIRVIEIREPVGSMEEMVEHPLVIALADLIGRK